MNQRECKGKCKKMLEINSKNFEPNKSGKSYRLECRKCRDYRMKHTLKGRYRCYKAKAKSRGYKFNITIKQFQKLTENVNCTYCGDFYKVCGVDRVYNPEGYKGLNVVSCCETCNQMKSNRGLIEYIEHCSKIAKNLKHLKKI